MHLTLKQRRPGRTILASLGRMAERMSDGIVQISAARHVVYCNSAFASLLGRSVAALIGADVTCLLTDGSRKVFEAHWTNRRQGDDAAYHLCWSRLDGTIADSAVLPTPLFTAAGEFDGAVAIVSDRAQHERTGVELSIARRLVANGSSILYRIKAAPGFPLEYVSSNVDRYGYSATETIRAGNWHEIIHKDDRARVLAALVSRLAERSASFRQEYRMYAASGDVIWAEEQSIVEYASDGNPVRIEGLLTDVTSQRRSQHQLRSALAQTIRAIGAVTEIRDPYTGIHQRRVADLSMAIGRKMHLDAERLEGLFLGALVHDVGKVSIPIDVLSRPSKLTVEEMALVRTHVRAGVALFADIDLPWNVLDIIGQHHERMDGSGYPRGLTKDEIVLESRVVSVADVYEAMHEHRPYRPARGSAAALAELQQHAGTRYDPAVVDACVQVLAEHGSAEDGLWSALADEDLLDTTVMMRAAPWPVPAG